MGGGTMELDKSIEYIIRYLSPKYRIPNSLRRKWSIYRNSDEYKKTRAYARGNFKIAR